jgi:hypothetical protein
MRVTQIQYDTAFFRYDILSPKPKKEESKNSNSELGITELEDFPLALLF